MVPQLAPQPAPDSLLFDGAAAQLAGLLESAMDAIITVDGGQRIVQYNRAAEQTFGWAVSEILGQPLELLIPLHYQGSHAEHVRRFAATGVTSRRMSGSAVVHGLKKSGEEFPLDASISQVATPEGKLYTVILRDISDRVRAQEELSAYAAAASAIREQEKTRVARELHDELAQTLTAIKMDTIWLCNRLAGSDDEAAGKMAAILAMIDSSVASTRRIAADLRPLVLDDLGLVAAIEWLVQNFSKRHGIACALEVDHALELPEPWATGVFRIVQESLANVAKHAGAAKATVRIELRDSELLLSVDDDGCGFAVDTPRQAGTLGLTGLRERAQLLRGKLDIESTPGQGTRIHARIPVARRLA
jgi:PAS domain S-box-containing protein